MAPTKNTVWTVINVSLTVHPVNSKFVSTVLELEVSFEENNIKLKINFYENKIDFHH